MNYKHNFTRFAWFNLVYLIVVILWGAWVRITKSGAGCGAHWPTCNGEIIPLSPAIETLIEFTHRLSSGLSLPFVLILLFWAYRIFPKGHRVRWTVLGTLFFLLSEAALGAGLVKFELVADNASLARALTASLHLINTFTLSAFAALTAWWSQSDKLVKWSNPATSWLIIGLLAILLSSMMGAITALGDTLFPTQVFLKQGLWAHLQENLSSSTHFLVQLRIVHPFIAVLTGFYLIFTSQIVHEKIFARKEHQGALLLTSLVALQLLLGGLNIMLSAPGWAQILHLLLATLIWLGTLLYLVSCAEASFESSMQTSVH